MSNFIESYKDITKIPKRKYQGYIWYSDGKQKRADGKEMPDILNGNDEFSFTENHLNPFVVEALLYCQKEQISVMVKHNGAYLIKEYDLKTLPHGAELITEEKNYFSHRLEGKKICFKQLWIAEKDENCENMEVLNLKAIIFTGFDNSKKS